jgi:hypothetical protein
LHPLKDFDAKDWPSERRDAWIAQARLYDRGPESIHEIRRHTIALQKLNPPTDEARELRSTLVGLGEETIHLRQGHRASARG